jgi:hypothetical protein
MRKALIVTLGLASLGASASVQPAFAEKKTICRWHLTGAYLGDVETGPLGIGVKLCQVVDGPSTPKTPWRGSPAGYGKPIQELKLKNRL